MEKTKELKKLKRGELLDLLLEVTEENEMLKQKVEELTCQLTSREVVMQNAGSIAEASLQLSGVFQAAQDAANIYLTGLKKTNEQAELILEKAKVEAEQIRKTAKERSIAILEQAIKQAEAVRGAHKISPNSFGDRQEKQLAQQEAVFKNLFGQISHRGE